MKNIDEQLNRREALVRGASFAAAGVGASVVPRESKGAAKQPNDSPGGLPVAAINAVFAPATGTMEQGGVLFFDLDRSDLTPTVFGVSVDPGIAFDTEIGFQPIGGGSAFVKYELTLLDAEVNPVLDALFAAALNPSVNILTALHNHFLELNPKIKFLHGGAVGDPVNIAKALRNALAKSAQPFQAATPPGNTNLPNDQIADIIGGMSMISGDILSVDVDRKETIRELGIVLQPPMHIHSMFSFQALGSNDAAVNAEFVLVGPEVDAVCRTLRKNSFNVMALHNHELFIEPHLYYVHSFATGDPLVLAKAVREALNNTNSKFER